MTSAVKRSYPFGSRPTSLVEDSNQFQVAQIPSSHKKKPITSPNITKGRKNMKNLQLVVPPVRSSISAPNSPQLPPNNSTYSAYSHNRRPSTPLCFYQNKDVANSNAADPMALMSKTENAIGEELPYKEEPIRILDNLYLGSELNAANRSMLNRLNIEFILNVALLQSARSAMLSGIPLTVPPTSKHNKQIKYKKFFWTHNQENLISDFDSAFAFINEARSAGKSILVHCQCGVSRSASLIIGYVMEANSMNLNQAYEFVKNRSPYISPNMTESIKSHSRQSSIESDLLLKSHRRSSSIPRTQINNNSNHTTNNGLLSIQPHQATVKGNGSGRFHVITASMTPTTPTALSPASSLSPTSSTSPTTPSNELSSPTTNNSKSNRSPHHEILSGPSSGIFSKPILDGIFSPTRTSPPITPVTITNFHDLLGDDVNKDIYTIQ
nr:4296_t:CDS:2 [Entrophospora candida]